MPAGGLIAAGVGSAVIGGISAANQQSAASDARQKALQQYLAINVPDPTSQKLILQRYQQTGQLDPAMEQAINESATAQNDIALDPNTRSAQMAALSQLSNISANQGMDNQEKVQLSQGINAANTNEKGQRDAILQNAAARGVGGSGASLAAELEAEQAGANRSADTAMSAQSQASQRALQAMSQQGALAGSIHGQDYNQALNSANATDAINQFNTRNQNAAMIANTQAQNQAQAYNVQEGQNIANQNTGLSNYEQQSNKGLLQQQFNNQMTLAGGKANAESGVATQANANAGTQANMWGGIGKGLTSIGGSMYKPSKTTAQPMGFGSSQPMAMAGDPNEDNAPTA